MRTPRPAAECRLADAYTRAHYRLPAPAGDLTLTFDPLARGRPVGPDDLPPGPWAILAAANPWSKSLPEPVNAARTAALRAELAARRLEAQSAVNAAPDGEWREDSFLVCGIGRDDVLALLRRHQQAAAVFGLGPRCGLLWTRSERWVVLRAYTLPAQ